MDVSALSKKKKREKSTEVYTNVTERRAGTTFNGE